MVVGVVVPVVFVVVVPVVFVVVVPVVFVAVVPVVFVVVVPVVFLVAVPVVFVMVVLVGFVAVVPVVFVVVVPIVFVLVVPVVFVLVVPVVFVLVVPVVFVLVVLCGGRLCIVVVRFAVIPCSRVVLVRRRRHCPLLSCIVVVVHRGCGWWCVVVRGAGPRIVVTISRRPWLWPCLASCSSLVVVVPLSEKGVGRRGPYTYLAQLLQCQAYADAIPPHPPRS